MQHLNSRQDKASLTGRYQPVWMAVKLVLIIAGITRLALLVKTGRQPDLSLPTIVGSFLLGIVFDLAMSAYLIVPFVLQIWLTNDFIYRAKWRWVTGGLFAIGLLLYFFSNLVPSDFNADLKKGVGFYFLFRFAVFVVLNFTSAGFRKKWRVGVLYVDFFLLIFLLLFNAVSEWFFWDEFSVRYNFIAVDYLVYTNEVLGNIQESYPIPAIFAGIGAVTLLLFFFFKKPLRLSVYAASTFANRSIMAGLLLAASVLFHFLVKEDWRKFSKNEYANELAGNGVYQFGNAFWHNELDFFKFYPTLPDSVAFSIVREDLEAPNSQFTSTDVFNLERQITYPGPELRHNVVLISVESFSADFMEAFGNQQHITPYLDSLAKKSLFFKNLYATGTRTVRGLEALSIALPPSAGQSIVKRPNNEDLFSLGSIFKSKGYTTQYIYGGYSYFDNMKYYFGHNGYEVIDRDSLKPEEIHYQNIWGVADEDLFSLAGKTLDRNHSTGRPFFTQIMTVSNHRPFTYPAGRIDIDPASQSREGGVKYTDYAINRFLKESASKPWFNNTIFIIVADHCAGSAGNVELPVTGYHIPMLIYAPAIFPEPKAIETMTSQIDIAPTLLGMLRFNYRSLFMGRDIFALPEGKERAFISTYQGLGYIRNQRLTILSPVKKLRQYTPDFTTGNAKAEQQIRQEDAQQAIAFYQAAAWLIKNKQYRKLP